MDGKRVPKPEGLRRRHADDFKQALVQRSLVPGASVAAIAQEAGVNANLLFNWRRLHLQGLVPARSSDGGAVLLPVTVEVPVQTPGAAPPASASAAPPPTRPAPASSIEIDISGARVRVRGPVDEAGLRAVLRALTRTT